MKPNLGISDKNRVEISAALAKVQSVFGSCYVPH